MNLIGTAFETTEAVTEAPSTVGGADLQFFFAFANGEHWTGDLVANLDVAEGVQPWQALETRYRLPPVLIIAYM